MTDVARITLLRDRDAVISASVVYPDGSHGLVVADSPGHALELIALELDRREAILNTAAAATGEASDVVAAHLERAQEDDLDRVLEVLEDAAGGPSLSTSKVAQLTGIASLEARAGAMGSDGRSRTLRALRLAEYRGAVQRDMHMLDAGRKADEYLWRLKPLDEVRAAAIADPRGEADR